MTKDTISKVKIQRTPSDKTFATYVTNKELVFTVFENKYMNSQIAEKRSEMVNNEDDNLTRN